MIDSPSRLPPSRLSAFVVSLAALVSAACGQPPRQQMEVARQALDQAAESDGVLRAPQICAPAQADLARAEAEVRLQLKRSAWSRNFEEASLLASRAALEGQRCAARARTEREVWRKRALDALADLDTAIQHASSLARHVPDGEGIKSQILKATLALGEGRSSCERDQFERAAEAAARGRKEVRVAVTTTADFFREYQHSPRSALWRRWVRETAAFSKREGRTVILIDKLRRQLLVIHGDEDVASYPADLGTGGIDSKTRAGDEFTPEGRYLITEVRAPGQTRYHRALMLNYPNDEDRERFNALKRSGKVPASGRIGSNIEIHGEGGRTQNWTQGCVALSNEDIDDLVTHVKAGTPVTIVGTIPDGALE